MATRPPLSGNPKIGPEDANIVLKFGGGLHTRASPDEIDPREAAGGFNFTLDIQNRNLRNRPPFDLIGTVPNNSQINGGGSLLKSDGTVTAVIQAGATVYQWNGGNSFTSKGSVTSSAVQLRGHWRHHSWNLNPDALLLTDLSLNQTVMKWDGTTLSNVTFTNESGAAFGSFFAKYLNISAERAVFANVKAGSTTPHLIVGCKRSDYTQITVNNRPSSSLGTGDPFFLPVPDLRPINGNIESFGKTIVSTEKGQLFYLAGSSAQDFSFLPFYPGSAATGKEAVSEIGDDIIYGRQGRIESVQDTNTFGNSESSDVSAIISDQIAAYTGWTLAFNSRTRKLYLFPTGVSEVWVMDQALKDAGQLSPWMRWKTTHSLAFQPTFVDSMLDPADGLEYIIMGDASGNLYRMEGTGTAGDGGTNTIETQFLSKLISARLDSEAYDVEGYVKYTRNFSGTITLTFQYQGRSIFNKSATVTLPAASGGAFWGGNYYWNDGVSFWNTTSGQLARLPFNVPGKDSDFQVLVDFTGTNAQSINEIGIRLRAAGSNQ